MKHEFWSERWSEGRIAFHQADGHPRLPMLIDSFPSGRVLVPLAGKTVDIVTLHSHGYDVTAVEFVASAVQAFAEEHPELRLEPHEGPLGFELRGERLRFIVGDFFAVHNADVGKFDLVYDRAALIALPPDRRQPYVDQVRRLVKPSGQLLTLTVEYDESKMNGPPFSVPPSAVRTLYDNAAIDPIDAMTMQTAGTPFEERGLDQLTEHIFRIADAAQ